MSTPTQTPPPPRREAVDVVFQSFNRYLGVAVGEHLGYLLTGAWTVLLGIAFTQTTVAPGWLGIPGIIIGAVLALCSLEFVGPAERDGWKLAATLTPITYIAWSLWLVALRHRSTPLTRRPRGARTSHGTAPESQAQSTRTGVSSERNGHPSSMECRECGVRVRSSVEHRRTDEHMPPFATGRWDCSSCGWSSDADQPDGPEQ